MIQMTVANLHYATLLFLIKEWQIRWCHSERHDFVSPSKPLPLGP